MDILIAEDHFVYQKLLTKKLRERNCNPILVDNGQQALDYLANPANPRPRMIILKTSLPVLSGLEAACILRTDPLFAMDPVLRATPIIATFAMRNLGTIKVYFDDALSRPIRDSHLEMLLMKWSRRELGPGPGASGLSFQPAWGPFPFRAHRGPRSLL